jgi:RHS repeat-associated protein
VSLREELGATLLRSRGFNGYTGRLASVLGGPNNGAGAPTGSHQNDTYLYDSLGNLTYRAQLIITSGALMQESFGYDTLNRLDSSTVNGSTKSYGYDAVGNLKSKSGVGSYAYGVSGAASVRPNAVSSISGSVAGIANPSFSYDANGNLASGLGREYGWTAANRVSTIDRRPGGGAVDQRTGFIYSPERMRVRQYISPVSGGNVGTATNTIWYAGAIEKEIDSAANTTTLRFSMPLGLGFVEERHSGTAIAPTTVATRNARYFLKDHLGSVNVITDDAGAVLQRLSYDAWGRRRNADGSDDAGAYWGTLKNTQDHSGYTGHEHIDQVALVNMNGRLYDPITARMLSADPTVPDVHDAQALNRYSYVLGNPLRYTDPSGFTPSPCLPPSCVVITGQRPPTPTPPYSPPAWSTGSNAPGSGGILSRALAAVRAVAQNPVVVAAAMTATAGIWFPIVASIGNPDNGSPKADADALSIAPGTDSAEGAETDSAGGEEGCIYCVKGDKTSSGKDYVGSTDNMDQRKRDTSDGRDREGAEIVDKYQKGDRDDRRAKEQQAINDRGGVDKLDNRRNEVAPKNWDSRGITPPRGN